MDAGTTIINMPLKSYLCKFLKKKYGNYHKVKYNSLLGLYLKDLLDKNYRKKHVVIKSKDYFPFHFPKTIVEKQGFEISAEKMKIFEVFIQKLFRSSLDDYIVTSLNSELIIKENNKEYQLAIRTAMKQYLHYFDITEDELKLDSLYRDYNREKSKLNNQIGQLF